MRGVSRSATTGIPASLMDLIGGTHPGSMNSVLLGSGSVRVLVVTTRSGFISSTFLRVSLLKSRQPSESPAAWWTVTGQYPLVMASTLQPCFSAIVRMGVAQTWACELPMINTVFVAFCLPLLQTFVNSFSSAVQPPAYL